MRRSATFAFALLCVLACASTALAEDVDKQVQKMNKRAMDDYDSLEFESARRTLLDAVQMLRANGLDDTPTAARTYANLAIVYINGFKDRNRGVHEFVNALRIKPDLTLDPALDTPELADAFGEAQKKAKVGAKPPKPPTAPPPTTPPPVTPPPTTGTTPPAEEVKGLQHTPIDESRPNTPVPVRAKVGPDVGAAKVLVFFRGSGQEDFLSVPMKNTGGVDWVGVIPADAVTGKSLQYYLEARDARGRTVAQAGSAPNPFILSVSETAAPPSNVPEVDVEDPLMKERLAKKRAAEEKKSTRDHLFVFVMPGFGFGVEPAGNHTEVAWQFQSQGANANKYVHQPVGSTGTAVAPFHLAAELGWLVTQHLSLSVLGRFQLVTGANAETIMTATTQGATTKAFGAVAVMARARYRFFDGRFHPYVHVDIGGGEIRHVLDISGAESATHPLVDRYTADRWNNGDMDLATYQQEVCANHNNCSDTISLGYFLLGGGAGLWYDFASHFAFIFDVNLLGAVGTGDRQSGFNIDVQIGLGAHFL